ncbi:MAG: carbon monoxide dehydrogenase [Lysinibacillus sp.]
MLKKLYYVISLFSIVFIFSTIEGVYANPQTPSFEGKFSEAGYKSVENAVKDFENHDNFKVRLPTILPSISYTHNFGKFYLDKEYSVNDALHIMFVNEDIKENIFKIDIRSLNNKLDFEGKDYTLQDGTKGIYFEHQLFNFFVFEKYDLQYMLGINKKVADKVTPESLVEMANSI